MPFYIQATVKISRLDYFYFGQNCQNLKDLRALKRTNYLNLENNHLLFI